MNRNKLTLLTSLTLLALVVHAIFSPSAAAIEDHSQSLDDVLNSIIINQDVASASEINCDQLSDNQLEELGEAVMGQMHPDPEIHESMDQMMGGEGSESLRQAHIAMAQRYLGCGNSVGMMMDGMMGQDNLENDTDSINKSQYYPHMLTQAGMMGFPAGGWSSFSVIGIITWLSLIVFLLSGTYFFIKVASGYKNNK